MNQPNTKRTWETVDEIVKTIMSFVPPVRGNPESEAIYSGWLREKLESLESSAFQRGKDTAVDEEKYLILKHLREHKGFCFSDDCTKLFQSAIGVLESSLEARTQPLE